jgi:hypothetical protein
LLSQRNSRPPSKRFVESLQARIHVLEEELASLQRSQLSSTSEQQVRVDDTPQLILTSASEYGTGTSTAAHESVTDDITDTLGRLKVDDDDGQVRFFGSQSNFNLLHDQPGHKEQSLHAQVLPESLVHEVNIPWELQTHLIELYFRWQNPWLYIIDKDTFLREFESGNPRQYCTPLLLLAIFALASRFSDRSEIRADCNRSSTAGDAFAEQARLKLLVECDHATVATAQAAALLSIRWMAENKEPAGWVYIGES